MEMCTNEQVVNMLRDLHGTINDDDTYDAIRQHLFETRKLTKFDDFAMLFQIIEEFLKDETP